MAHVLNIIYGGTTINLASGSIALLKYVPLAPADLSENATITEQVKIEISGANAAAIQALAQSINVAFGFARQKVNTRSGVRVFAEIQPDGYISAFRSELIDGRLDLDANALDDQWVEKKIDCVITWTRRYFWEGPLTALNLTNGGGSGTTCTIYNHDDATAGHDNWVQLDASAVSGDLPAPLYAFLTNTSASGTMKDVYYAANYIGTPANLTHLLEAESATGGTTTADATCSGGNRKDLSWSTTAETTLLTWTLANAQLVAADNQYFQTLLRFSSAHAYTNMWLRWVIQWNGVTVWAGPLTKSPQTTLQELSAIQLPPGLLDSNSYDLTLVLSGLRRTAGTHNLAIDFVQLMPMMEYRRLKAKSTATMGQNGILIDDQVEGDLYTRHGTLRHAPTHTGTGRARVWPGAIPGTYQRIYFLQQDGAGTAGVDRTIDVNLSYRARRITL